jgi:site-specific DNA-methyltransferase (adenine-specific)
MANGKYSVTNIFDSEKGNIFFDATSHNWENGRCSFCGASQSEYEREEGLETHAYQFIHNNLPDKIKNMKFDVIIGNPPYQLATGGAQAQAIPLYDKFVLQAKKMNPRFLAMIIPSRWFSGGMGLNDFRSEMLNDNRIRKLVDYPLSSECFPGVEIKGGVCYFLWDRDNSGKCNVITIRNNNKRTSERFLLEEGNNIFIRFNEALPILDKVKKLREESFANIVSSQKPFGFPTNFRGKTKRFKNSIKIYVTKNINYINPKEIINNRDWVNKYKVLITKGYGAGEDFPHQIINKPILSEPNSCCSETYIILGVYNNKEQAENAISYIKTKFFRFLVMLQKNTQDALKRVYTLAPLQDFSESWTDEKLYKKYKLTKEEIDFIESMIRPMN